MPDEFNTEGGYVSFYKSIKLKNTCILFVQILCAVEGGSKFRLYCLPEGEHNYQEFSLEVEVPVFQTERGFVLTGY